MTTAGLPATIHRRHGKIIRAPTLTDDVWELYDTRGDFSLAHDLAGENPEKLKEMQNLFMKVASANHVLPIDDRSAERIDPRLRGGPTSWAGRSRSRSIPACAWPRTSSSILRTSRTALRPTSSFPKLARRASCWPRAVRFGGWSLYVKDDKPTYEYNWLGLKHYNIAAKATSRRARPRSASISPMTAAASVRAGRGDPRQWREGRRGTDRQTQCCMFALDETADVGMQDRNARERRLSHALRLHRQHS